MVKEMTVGSLFSGIGGLDLGFEWAGFETKWFCEIEEFPRKVLNKHWPDVPIINDIRDVTARNVQPVDVLIGGFPCQDISNAGKGAGIDYDLSEQEGTRSGLWWEYWRVIRDLRPKYVVAENVAALTNRGLDIVLGSLAEIGYDAEWQIVSAATMGAPHIRERIFIVAYPKSSRHGGGSGEERGDTQRAVSPTKQGRGSVGSETKGCSRVRGEEQPNWFTGDTGQPHPVSFRLGDTDNAGLEGQVGSGLHSERRPAVGATNSNRSPRRVEVEYDFRGVAHGVSDRVGALKGYGNAVVPQVAYLVARAVREHAEEQGEWLR